jgi:PD-(D/E)XK nuclease superfamily
MSAQPAPQFEFDPESHIYRLNGVEIVSVTQALTEAGLIDLTYYREWHSDRGRAVHAACHYDDEGDLDQDSVAPELRGYLRAYRRFKEESGFVPTVMERPLYCPTWRFGGTVDRLGHLPQYPHVLMDLKTGVPIPSTDLQLAAYAWLVSEPRKWRRLSVYLHRDGTYNTAVPKAAFQEDWNAFLGALTVANWKRKVGMK